MNDLINLENDLRQAGRGFEYPPTPDIASAVRARLRPQARHRSSRQWAWALVTLLVLFSALMLVPPARAAILDFIQIGVVRIFRVPPAPIQAPTALPGVEVPTTATPASAPAASATPLSPALDLAGQTTLADAQARLSFPILIPTYPPDLGMPDGVYLQNMGGSMLLLVWLDPAQSGRVRMSLQEIEPGSWTLDKFEPQVIEETQVHGGRAIWTEGPYMLETRNRDYTQKRLIEGHVLIWMQGDITYRLETGLSLEEAIKIAESLEPPKPSEIPIPADLSKAKALVQWLSGAGIGVRSVRYSVNGALFQAANQAAWIETDIGVADAVFFLDPAAARDIHVELLKGREAGRYVYSVQAPRPIMQDAVTIDSEYPLYFQVGNGIFVETESAKLGEVIQRYLTGP